MTLSVMDLIAKAKGEVPTISPEELMAMSDRADILIIDVRDHPEVAKTGKIKGAMHVTRGMLEFLADEATPYFDPVFFKDKTIVLYCASGGRAALCGQSLLELGFQDVRNLGALADWRKIGGPMDPP